MKSIVVSIGEEGDLSCLYNEEIDLEGLGDAYTRRASNVSWCPARKEWFVALPNGTQLRGWAKRSEAIEAEIEYLNRKIRDDTITDIFGEET